MPEEVTGTNAIRARVWSRWKKANLSITSRELQIPLHRLEAFAKGEGQLPVEQMHLLCREFFPYFTRFNPETDKLEDTSPPAAKGGTPPEPYKNPNEAVQAAHDAYMNALRAARGPEPAASPPAKPEPRKLMPGWSNRFL